MASGPLLFLGSMEVHLALANKDPYGELLATSLAFLELVFLLLDQTKPHLGHSDPMVHLSGHHIEFHAFEGLQGTQIVIVALAAFLAFFLAKVPHKEHQISLEMEVPSLHCSSQILLPQSSHQITQNGSILPIYHTFPHLHSNSGLIGLEPNFLVWRSH